MARSASIAREVESALEAYRSSEANQQPLRYAPWVLSLLLVIVTKDRLASFTLEAWGWMAVAILGLLVMAGRARAALGHQRTQAIFRIYHLLRRPGGPEALLELRSTHPRLARTKLPGDLEHAVVVAIRELEAGRERQRRQQASAAHERREASLPVG